MFASYIRKGRVHQLWTYSNGQRHFGEMFVKINGQTHCLWRAVDRQGGLDQAGRGLHGPAVPPVGYGICQEGKAMGVFGGGLSDVRTTVETFRPNAEAQSQHSAEFQTAALRQFGAEFTPLRGRFDRIIDGLNSLPRPAMAVL